MKTTNVSKSDLDLKDLNNYHGTEVYHRYKLLGIEALGTDGTEYVSNNGYWWVVWDAIVICKVEIKPKDDIVLIKLKIDNGKADMIYTSLRTGKELYKQHYDITDAKKEFSMYYHPAQNIICLTGED